MASSSTILELKQTRRATLVVFSNLSYGLPSPLVPISVLASLTYPQIIDLSQKFNDPVAQSCAVAKSENFWRATGQSTWHTKSCAVAKSENFWRATGQSTWHTKRLHGYNKNLPKFGFRTHTTALWPVEQSSILSARFDCPVAHQEFPRLAIAHFTCIIAVSTLGSQGFLVQYPG